MAALASPEGACLVLGVDAGEAIRAIDRDQLTGAILRATGSAPQAQFAARLIAAHPDLFRVETSVWKLTPTAVAGEENGVFIPGLWLARFASYAWAVVQAESHSSEGG
jgi:hypothetical protein